MQLLSSIYQDELPVGEIKCSNEELSAAVNLSPKLPRTALLSAIAARESLTDAGWTKRLSPRTGFISANTVGGMDKT